MRKKTFVGYVPESLNIKDILSWDNDPDAILIWWNGNIHSIMTSVNNKKVKIIIEELPQGRGKS